MGYKYQVVLRDVIIDETIEIIKEGNDREYLENLVKNLNAECGMYSDYIYELESQ